MDKAHGRYIQGDVESKWRRGGASANINIDMNGQAKRRV